MDGWADTLSNLAGKYLDYRRVESQDALSAQQAQYQAEALRAQTAAAQESKATASGWVMPALLIGGVVVALLLVRR